MIIEEEKSAFKFLFLFAMSNIHIIMLLILIRLYDDEEMPSQHMPRGYRHSRSDFEEEVCGKTRTCRQLFVYACRRGRILLFINLLLKYL